MVITLNGWRDAYMQPLPSYRCPLATQPWHDDKTDERYRQCCDHAPIGPATFKGLYQYQPGPTEVKSPTVAVFGGLRG